MGKSALQEKYEEMVRRYNSMCAAAEKNQAEVTRLALENSVLKTDVIRLAEEARLAQQNAQLLGDDFNKRALKAATELGDLRALLRTHGLDEG